MTMVFRKNCIWKRKKPSLTTQSSMHAHQKTREKSTTLSWAASSNALTMANRSTSNPIRWNNEHKGAVTKSNKMLFLLFFERSSV